MRKLRFLKYKKNVFFHSIANAPNFNTSSKRLYVYEKINDRIKLVCYSLESNYLALQDVFYGQVLHKCSMDILNDGSASYYFY